MNQDKIWDYFQTAGVDSFDGSFSRLKYLTSKFNKEQKVLNIGVGSGLFEKLCLQKGIIIYSLDPSEKTINELKSIIGEDRAEVGYSQEMMFEDDMFDGVVMSEVIEHLDEQVMIKTFEQVKRVLKKGGKFIGTVPSNENLSDQLVVCPKCGEKFHRWGHVQTFTLQRMANILSPFFRINCLEERLFTTWKTLNWKGKFLGFVNKIFFQFKLKKSGLNIFFIAEKI